MQARPEPPPPGPGREPQLAEGMARALVLGLAPVLERALEALRSNNSEGALALGRAQELPRALALDRQAQGPDTPVLA